MFERMDPKTFVKWLLVAALVYLLLPYDLLPDFLGLPGRIDDVMIMGWLAWIYRNHVRQYQAKTFARDDTSRAFNAASGEGARRKSTAPALFDAYEVLGISRSASGDAIQEAYRARMHEYHPDKVAHLGEDLQKLAHEKSQEIQRAYRQLRD